MENDLNELLGIERIKTIYESTEMSDEMKVQQLVKICDGMALKVETL
jgi:hypothetical protein